MNESNLSERDEEDFEAVPFDQVVDASHEDADSKGGAGNRKSLIESVVVASSDRLVGLIENNAAIKVNAFNSADQEEAD